LTRGDPTGNSITDHGQTEELKGTHQSSGSLLSSDGYSTNKCGSSGARGIQADFLHRIDLGRCTSHDAVLTASAGTVMCRLASSGVCGHQSSTEGDNVRRAK
jgi:hypothetical protein